MVAASDERPRRAGAAGPHSGSPARFLPGTHERFPRTQTGKDGGGPPWFSGTQRPGEYRGAPARRGLYLHGVARAGHPPGLGHCQAATPALPPSTPLHVRLAEPCASSASAFRLPAVIGHLLRVFTLGAPPARRHALACRCGAASHRHRCPASRTWVADI